MRKVCEKPQAAIVNIARNPDAAGIFAIRAFDDRRAIDVVSRGRGRLKARCADSESGFLAIKKFSRLPALRLIAARQNRFLGESPPLIRAGVFAPRDGLAALDGTIGVRARTQARRRRRCRRHLARRSDAEFGLEQIIHDLRIGLAAG